MKYYFCIFFCFFCLFPFAKAQNLNELILSGPENSKDEIAEEQNISVPKSNFWNRGFYDFSICAGKTNYKGLDKDFVNSTPEGDVPSIGLAATRFASLFCQKISVEAKMIPASEDNVSKFTGISRFFVTFDAGSK